MRAESETAGQERKGPERTAQAIYETEPLKRATFVERPNRFLVRFRRRDEEGLAYLANPGRLGEILLPGAELLLAQRPHTTTGREAVGVTWLERWPGDPPRSVFLNTSMVNDIAQRLIERGLIPEFEGFRVVRREHPVGESRFDFLLARGRDPYLLEVKSVTLVEHGLALFPDARTERGRRHLEELVRYRRKTGHRTGVLFIVQGAADRFLPDFHSDLEFARAFLAARESVEYLPYCLEPELSARDRIVFSGRPRRLDLPEGLLEAGTTDSGLYFLVLALPGDATIRVGELGRMTFRRGFYVYVGSARRNLSRRLERHLRRRKRLHWHVDYLRSRCAQIRALPLRAAPLGECELAAEVRGIALAEVEGFGCSDCRCGSHLLYFPEQPFESGRFQEMLTRLRHTPKLHRGAHAGSR